MIILRTPLRWLFATSLTLLCFSCQMDEQLMGPDENLSGADDDGLRLLEVYDSHSQLGDWNILFEETFEEENPFYAYVSKQFSEGHSFRVSNSPSFKGKHVGRFELRKSDDKATRTGKRAEILIKEPSDRENWYSFAVYLPSDGFKKDGDDEVITQWHSSGGTPTVSLRVMNDNFVFRVGHDPDLKTTLWDNFDFGRIPKNEWINFVFHIVHSENRDGLVEIWRNGNKILTHSGPNKYKGESMPRWKVGIYKHTWAKKSTDTDTRILYYDNIRMGNEKASFEEMDPSEDNDKGWGPYVPEIESFSLINSIGNKVLGLVPNNGIINIGPLDDNRISLRANFAEDFEGSVEFELKGPKNLTVTRNEAEYSLYGYDRGNYHNHGGTPKGNYTLVATPYLGHNKSGKIGKPVTFKFKVTEEKGNDIINGIIEKTTNNDLVNSITDSRNSENSDPSSSNLVGHWKMDENSGSTIQDYSGKGNHARIENSSDISWVSGKHGNALRMNGRVDRFATVPHNSSVDLSETITIAAWIRPTKKGRKQILSKGNGYELSIFENGKVEFRINRGTNAKDYMIQSKKDYPTNGSTWMHVAVTFDGRKSTLYINGEEDNSSTYNATRINTNRAPLQIGAKNEINRWIGSLDDLRLYNEALSSSQIMDIYK